MKPQTKTILGLGFAGLLFLGMVVAFAAVPTGYQTTRIGGVGVNVNDSQTLAVSTTSNALLVDVNNGTFTVPGTMTLAGSVTLAAPASIGSGTLTCTGTAAGACLAGTASYPCTRVVLCTASTGVSVGAGTGSCYLPLPQNVPLTVAGSNANLFYASGGTAATVGYLWSN